MAGSVHRGYKTGKGCSGFTYKNGVVEAIRVTSPAIFIFENVVGVADCPRDTRGNRQDPPVKDGQYYCTVSVFVFVYCTVQYSRPCCIILEHCTAMKYNMIFKIILLHTVQ